MEAIEEVEPTWSHAARVWWSLVWRGTLFGAIAGTIAGAVVGVAGGMAGWDQQSTGTLANAAGLLAGVPIGVCVVKSLLKKSFAGFRLALVSSR